MGCDGLSVSREESSTGAWAGCCPTALRRTYLPILQVRFEGPELRDNTFLWGKLPVLWLL